MVNPAAAGSIRDTRQLSSTVDRVDTLSDGAVDAMFSLYDQYYDATSRPLFEADLRNKDYVVTLREPSGALAGFSTLAVLEAEIGGTRLRAIYSGDTIIDQAHWGTQALAFTWIRNTAPMPRVSKSRGEFARIRGLQNMDQRSKRTRR